MIEVFTKLYTKLNKNEPISEFNTVLTSIL